MDKLRRKKAIESLLGRTYFVVIETDPERGEHYVKIYDQDPEPEPIEFRVFGLKFTLSPPDVAPIIERYVSVMSDLQERIEQLIYEHELPEIQLTKLDRWDGRVRWRPPEPEQEGRTSRGKKKAKAPENNIVRIKDWSSPEVVYYDRLTGRVWTEGGGAK